jgi:hypothetical protein
VKNLTATQNLILYEGGSYGTFFEWLFTHIHNPKLAWPFKTDGSSHNFRGNFLSPPQKLFEHIESGNKLAFSRTIPYLLKQPNQNDYEYNNDYEIVLQTDLDFLKKHFDKILTLSYDYRSLLWYENNCLEKFYVTERMMEKLTHCGYSTEFLEPFTHMDPVARYKSLIRRDLESDVSWLTEKILMGWNKTRIEDFDIWELRELLSFSWFVKYDNQISAWHTIKQRCPDVMHISITELRDNFVETVTRAIEYMGIENVSTENIKEIHDHWLPLQKHIGKDALCDKIVRALLRQDDFDWSTTDLSIIDEAWIQKTLRDNQIGIKCHQLNIFPTNSKDFLPLLEPV